LGVYLSLVYLGFMDEKKKRRESKERKETRQVSHKPVIMLLSLNDSLELKE